MSYYFYLQVPANTPVLSVGDFAQLLPDFRLAALDPETTDADEPEEYLSPLLNLTVVTYVRPEFSVFGLRVTFDDKRNAYELAIHSPCALQDWTLLKETVRALALRYSSGICVVNTIEGERTMSLEELEAFDPTDDILLGIKRVEDALHERGPMQVLMASRRPIFIDQEIVDKIKASDSPAQAFSDFAYQTQYPNAALTPVHLVQDQDGTPTGLYIIRADVPAVLPITPYQLKEDKEEPTVKRWTVLYVAEEVEGDEASLKPVDEIELEFLNEVLSKIFIPLDANSHILPGIPRETMEEIFTVLREGQEDSDKDEEKHSGLG